MEEKIIEKLRLAYEHNFLTNLSKLEREWIVEHLTKKKPACTYCAGTMLAFAKQAYQIYLNNKKAEEESATKEESVSKKSEEKNGAKKTNRRKNK